MFGAQIVNTLKFEDLENYRDRREGEGASAATIDMEISISKTMSTRAFDNDKVDGRTVKVFRRVQRCLKGMDAYYLKPTDEDLRKAMARYTGWIEKQIFTAVAKGPQMGPKKKEKGLTVAS